jgi:hypothetical protein
MDRISVPRFFARLPIVFLPYYGVTGPVPTGMPLDRQTYQVDPGGDLKLGKRLLLSVGADVGLTSASNRLVYKSRVEYNF